MVHKRLRDTRVARDACRRRAFVADLGERADRYRQDALAAILIPRRRKTPRRRWAGSARHRSGAPSAGCRGRRPTGPHSIGRHITFASAAPRSRAAFTAAPGLRQATKAVGTDEDCARRGDLAVAEPRASRITAALIDQ